jgi:signal transduction histidine kinase
MMQSGPSGGVGSNSLEVDPYTLMGAGRLYRAIVVRTIDPLADQGTLPIEELSKVDPAAPDLPTRIGAIAKAEKVDIWVFGPLDMRAIPLRLPPRATASVAERLGKLVWPSLAFDFNTQSVALLPLTGETAAVASGTVASVQLVGFDNTDYWNTVAQFTQPDGSTATHILPQTVAFVVVWNRPPARPTALQSAWSRWQRLIVGWFPIFFGAAMALLVLTLVASPAAFVYERRLAARVRAREEMARLRRDVHDRVYNRLSALSKRVAASGQEVNARNSEALGAIAEDIRTTVGDLQEILGDEVRHANRALTTVPLAEQLAAICEAQATRLGVEIACDAGDEPLPEVDARLGWDLQCIAEEAVSNAVRHGSATHVRVRIARAGGALELTVADDGSGSTVLAAADAAEGSTGLRGVVARLSRWGGSLSLRAGDTRGTVLVARVPLGED